MPSILGIGPVTTVGIERWQESDLAATVRPHRGRLSCSRCGASRFNDYCSVEVDVAAGQLLDVQFGTAARRPPIPPEELCPRAGSQQRQLITDAAWPAEFATANTSTNADLVTSPASLQ